MTAAMTASSASARCESSRTRSTECRFTSSTVANTVMKMLANVVARPTNIKSPQNTANDQALTASADESARSDAIASATTMQATAARNNSSATPAPPEGNREKFLRSGAHKGQIVGIRGQRNEASCRASPTRLVAPDNTFEVSEMDYAAAHTDGDRLRAILRPELVHDVAYVDLDGLF